MNLDVNFINPFIAGTLKTLSVQAQIEAVPGKPFLKGQQPQPDFEIAAMIGITSSSFNGSIALQFTEQVYLGIMSNMLGEKYTEISQELQDGAAELLNMIFGSAKVVLNEKGHNILKAIPTFIRGKSIQSTRLGKVQALVIPFQTQFGEFHIEVIVD